MRNGSVDKGSLSEPIEYGSTWNCDEESWPSPAKNVKGVQEDKNVSSWRQSDERISAQTCIRDTRIILSSSVCTVLSQSVQFSTASSINDQSDEHRHDSYASNDSTDNWPYYGFMMSHPIPIYGPGCPRPNHPATSAIEHGVE